MGANPVVPDFWPFHGSKKLSDVDIILAEEQPTSEEPESAAEVPGSRAGTASALAAVADGRNKPDTADGMQAEEATAAAAPPASDGAGEQNEGGAAAATAAAAAANRKRKRQEGEHIFGHSIVLATLSGYCRTKLLDWDDATDTADQQGESRSSRARHEIQLLVPAGQLEAGRLLIKGMYQQQPDLSDVSQAQLIQLLLLADCFEVPKVQAAVSAAFKALPPEQLQWDTVMAVYGLPAGCAELAACQALFSAAATKLQHELGDLEMALTEPGSSQEKQLLGLPFGALKQLLQDERTRVSSENTVFYAIQQWHHQQQQIEASNRPQRQRTQQLESLRQQTQELLQLVRALQCSQLFIATVMGQWGLAASLFSYPDLLLASSYARSAMGQRPLPHDAASLPGFQRHPAWLLPARPPSAMTQLTINWKLPLAQLKEVFERHLETGEASIVLADAKVSRGLQLNPCVVFHHETSSDGQPSSIRKLGLFCYTRLQQGECRSAKTALKAHSFLRRAAGVDASLSSQQFTCKNSSWGRPCFVQLGAVNSWAEAELVLQNQGLVGGDGCLHLTMTVSDVE